MQPLEKEAQAAEVNRVRHILMDVMMETPEGFRSIETCLALLTIAVQILDEIDSLKRDDIRDELRRMLDYVIDSTTIMGDGVRH